MAVTSSAVLSALLGTCVLDITMGQEKGGWQSFLFVHHRRLFQQLLLRTAVVHAEMRSQNEIEVCSHLTASSREVLRQVSIPDSAIVVVRLRLGALSRLLQYSTSSGRTSRRYNILVHGRDRPKPAKPDVHLISNPYRPQSPSTALEIRLHQLWRRSSPRSFSVLLAPITLLVSHAD